MTVARSSSAHSLVGMFCWKIIIYQKRICLNFLEYLRMMAAKIQRLKEKQLLSSARQVSKSRRQVFIENCLSSRQVTHLKYIWQKSIFQALKWLRSSGSTLLITSQTRWKDFWIPGQELVQLSRIPSKILLTQQQESPSMFLRSSYLTQSRLWGNSKVSNLTQAYQDKKTTMKGVTTSLMPCTQPLAGCRICQTYSNLSYIQCTFASFSESSSS